MGGLEAGDPLRQARGMPVKPIAGVRSAAPAKMKAIMQVVRVAAERRG